MDIKKFKSIKQMNKTIGTPGQFAMVGSQVYQYNNKWEPWEPSGGQIEVAQNAYLMAKSVAAQAPLLTTEQIDSMPTANDPFANFGNEVEINDSDLPF